MRAFDRIREINRVRALLERDGYPRLQMLLLVAITGASGFVGSYLLLQIGLTEMWVRYLVAFAVAYLVFLWLLWLWMRTRAEDYADFADLLRSSGDASSGPSFGGRGGEFGGAGASGRFDTSADVVSVKSDTLGSLGDGVGAVADADELAIPLVVLAVLAALVLSSLWVVYSAPVLFAELLVDGVLAASLYRRLRGLDSNHWLETAIRRTVLPFVVAALIAAVGGWAVKLYAPEASSIGDVLLHAKASKV
jgi:hypothetical protein